MTGGARVRLETISKRFGATVAVDGVFLTIEPAEMAP
jgi:ABC-type branched-subunit amino acid transport system ATPase component